MNSKEKFNKYIIIFAATFVIGLLVEFYALFILPIVRISFQKTLGYYYGKYHIINILFGEYNYVSYIFIVLLFFNLLTIFYVHKLKETVADNILIILLFAIVFYLSMLHIALIEPGI